MSDWSLQFQVDYSNALGWPFIKSIIFGLSNIKQTRLCNLRFVDACSHPPTSVSPSPFLHSTKGSGSNHFQSAEGKEAIAHPFGMALTHQLFAMLPWPLPPVRITLVPFPHTLLFAVCLTLGLSKGSKNFTRKLL